MINDSDLFALRQHGPSRADRFEMMVRRRKRGASLRQIAAEFNLSKSHVCRLLAGVPEYLGPRAKYWIPQRLIDSLRRYEAVAVPSPNGLEIRQYLGPPPSIEKVGRWLLGLDEKGDPHPSIPRGECPAKPRKKRSATRKTSRATRKKRQRA